eukprot:sb/3475472/
MHSSLFTLFVFYCRQDILYRPKQVINQSSLFRSRDWLSANQVPVFPLTSSLREMAIVRPIASLKYHSASSFIEISRPRETAREPTETSKQPIRSVKATCSDWVSANQGPVFPDSVDHKYQPIRTCY